MDDIWMIYGWYTWYSIYGIWYMDDTVDGCGILHQLETMKGSNETL
jgi:hypothetical protein